MNHLAIIMDGNSRWAEKVGLPRFAGHEEGSKAAKQIIEYAAKNGIKNLSLFAFSTENWQRPEEEVQYLLYLLEKYLDEEAENLAKNKIKLFVIGRLEKLSSSLQDKINQIHQTSVDDSVMNLYITFSYGGRQEIVDAAKKCLINKINPETLTEETFQKFLYAPNMPDIDFVIRTGNRRRISNFLLWHMPYAEIYFSDKYWPEFSQKDLELAIADYQTRIRTFGIRH